MCGVVGVVLPDRGHEAAAVAATALFALQHRGQESAGIGVSDGRTLMIYKDLGMVGQVLDERRLQPGHDDRPTTLERQDQRGQAFAEVRHVPGQVVEIR
jgi:glutamine phosphoribosylpyrophosphate amidotransferase